MKTAERIMRPRVLWFENGPDLDVVFRYVNGNFESQDVRPRRGIADDAWVVRHQIPAAFVRELAALKRRPTEDE